MKIKMELLSDLCTSSGDSLSPTVDIEIAVDEYGTPYIPSKRIKGVLREVGETLCKLEHYNLQDLDSIFGKPGQMHGGLLRIDNGRIENYESIKSYLESCYSQHSNPMIKFFIKDYIIDYFTIIRDQTSIDKKTYMAKDNSLRKLRAIKKGNIFYFPIEIPGKFIKLFEDCCKLTRNIGLNRTRGFGEVKLTLIDDTPVKTKILHDECLNKYSDKYKKIKYKIKLIDNVIISGKDGNISEAYDYIPGTNVLGYFASRYIKENYIKNDAHRDPIFRRLFLEKNVIFDNAYISHNDIQYKPCPASIVKEKDKDNLYNLFVLDKKIDHNKLKNKYIHFKSDNRIEFKESIMQEHYHHKRAKDKSIGHAQKSEDENKNYGEFYQYEGLRKGQEFIGYINGRIEDIQKIIDLVPDDGEITIGKSKNTQYSKSQIEFIENKNFNKDEYLNLKGCIQIVLESPCILKNKYGFNTVNIKELEEEIRNRLSEIGFNNKLELRGAYINTTTISGFNAKWLLPKEQCSAFDKGSTLYFEYSLASKIDKVKIDSIRIGERKNEGYGKIYSIIDPIGGLKEESLVDVDVPIEKEPNELEDMLYYIQKKIFINQLTTNAIQKATRDYKVGNINRINSTTIGKLNQMLKDSINARRDDISVADDLERKINLIKDKGKNDICSRIIDKEKIQRQFEQTDIFRYDEKNLVPKILEEIKYLHNDFYIKYLNSYLNQLKYELRGDKN